jgi:hypothetical protein
MSKVDDATVVQIDRSKDPDTGAGKDRAPRESDEALVRIANDSFAREKLGRTLTLWLAIGMGGLASLCILFALYTGMHFLTNIEAAVAKSEEKERIAFAVEQVSHANKALQTESVKAEPPVATEKVKLFSKADAVQLIAPLIPATFSSALGLIILVTLTRFISGFVLSDRKDPPKDSDYGAIATLVQEVMAAIKSIRGGKD